MGVRLRVTLAAAGLFAVALTLASFVLVTTVHDNLADEIDADQPGAARRRRHASSHRVRRQARWRCRTGRAASRA